MLEAVSGFLLVVSAITISGLWMQGAFNSEGECRCDNCDCCPYEGDCPWGWRR